MAVGQNQWDSIVGVGAPPILVGIGMFTGGAGYAKCPFCGGFKERLFSHCFSCGGMRLCHSIPSQVTLVWTSAPAKNPATRGHFDGCMSAGNSIFDGTSRDQSLSKTLMFQVACVNKGTPYPRH